LKLSVKSVIYVVVFLNTLTSFGQNTPPTVTAVGNQIYCPQSQQPIVTFFDITDPDAGDTTVNAFWNGNENGGTLLYTCNLYGSTLMTNYNHTNYILTSLTFYAL
jgi:hypothetical protein